VRHMMCPHRPEFHHNRFTARRTNRPGAIRRFEVGIIRNVVGFARYLDPLKCNHSSEQPKTTDRGAPT
jgi:hypothetical protein